MTDELAEDLLKRAIAVARWMGMSHHDSEDLAQEAMVRFLNWAVRPGSPVHQPSAFVARVVQNLVLDRMRAPARSRPLGLDENQGDEQWGQRLEARDDVERLFSRASRRESALLQLKLEEPQLSWSECARRQGLRANAASVSLVRLRRRLTA